MDLIALKSIPLSSLPALSTVSNLLGNFIVDYKTNSRLTSAIGENISTIGSLNYYTKTTPAFFGELFLSPIFSTNFEKISNNLAKSLRIDSSPAKFDHLYEISLPLSVAVQRLSKHLDQRTDYSTDNGINWKSLLLPNSEGGTNSASSNSIPNAHFYTSLPISALRELSPGYKHKDKTRGSIANRQPYESEKSARKKPTENRRTAHRLINFFQDYLRLRIGITPVL